MEREIRFVVTNDEEVVRRGLKELLETQPGWRVVAATADGNSTIQTLQEVQPDILITDTWHPGPSGIEITAWVRGHAPNIRVVILTSDENRTNAIRNRGGRAYVTRPNVRRELVPAIHDVLQGRLVFPEPKPVIIPLGTGFYRDDDGDPHFVSAMPESKQLYGTNLQVLSLLASGKTLVDVATELNISLRTAETFRSNIFNVLEVNSVEGLIEYAAQNELSTCRERDRLWAEYRSAGKQDFNGPLAPEFRGIFESLHDEYYKHCREHGCGPIIGPAAVNK